MGSPSPDTIFFIGALLAAVTRGRFRQALLPLIPVVGILNLWLSFPEGAQVTAQIMDYTLTMMRVDRLSLLFGVLFHLATFIAIIFSLHVKDTSQHVAGLLCAGSALGAIFAGDMITLFIFWELLTVSSVFLILARRTERARQSTMRYLIIQAGAGAILLAGILWRAHETGSIAFDFIGLTGPASALILLAFGIKAAFPLLHNWLTDAYAEATPTGAVFLSAFTTKVAVYALARSFPGTELLVYVGAAMVVFPIFYAIIENDLRRVLCYSMVNQIGFMVCGIGMGTELAINGAVFHAFNDVIFKGLLFMSMGAVLFRTGKINASELGGLYKSMPFTAGFCIVGAASISAFPLLSGFVSKSMILSAALEQGHFVVWAMLLFASASALHYIGIKVPFLTFFSRDSEIRVKEAPSNMLVAMAIAAALCIFNGAYPWALYSLLPFPVDYTPYTAAHVLVQTQILLFSALAFAVFRLTHLYPPQLPGINIDAEWVYRRLGKDMTRTLGAFLGRFMAGAGAGLHRAFWKLIEFVSRHYGPEGVMARTMETGSMVFWMVLVLGAYLLLYFT